MSPMCLQLILDLLPRFVPVAAGSHRATLMIFFLETISERPKHQRLLWMPRSSSTTVLRKSVTICWNCQGLQSSEAKNCGFVRQSIGRKRTRLRWWRTNNPSIRFCPPCWIAVSSKTVNVNSCHPASGHIKTFPQVSPNFQSSLPHGSHTAPGALPTSIIVALWVWKSWSAKKGKLRGKPYIWPEHHAVLTWFCSTVENLPHQGQMIKKGKERNMSNEKETWRNKRNKEQEKKAKEEEKTNRRKRK